MFGKIELFWMNLGITRKISLIFSFLMAIIFIIFSSVLSLLLYVQKIEEKNVFNSHQVNNMVLQMSLKLEQSRSLEKDFFLQYQKLGFLQAYDIYVKPARDLILQVDSITAKLRQLLKEREVWKESDRNLELLFMAQSRHTNTMRDATELAEKLVGNNFGLQPELFKNLSLLYENLRSAEDPGMMNLYYHMEKRGRDYLFRQQRPIMQSSFNFAVNLRREIQLTPRLTISQKAQALTCLDNYLSIGEDIIATDVALVRKMSEFRLQGDTIKTITNKILAIVNQDNELFRKKTARINQLILGFMFASILLSLGLIWFVANLIGNSITDNIIKLTQAAKQFETDNRQIDIHIKSGDELGVLAGAFNSMAARIMTMVNHLEQMVDERTKRLNDTNRQLQKSEKNYRSLIENQTDLVSRFTPDGTFVFVNHVYCRFFDQPKEALIGSKWYPMLVDNDLTKKELSALSPANPTVTVESRVLSANGEIHWVQFVNMGIFDPSGNLQEIQSVGRDISKRKRSEEAMRESEEKYRTIFENIQDVYYETTLGGIILEISPSIENLSRYTRNELIGKSLNDIYTDPEERNEFLKAIIDTEKVTNFEVTLADKDGSVHFVELNAMLKRDQEGNPVKLIGSMRDISERKQLESQLLQSQKMESIGNLAGGVAHDFNNILSSVIGFTELSLDEVEKGTRIEDNLQEIYTAGKRAKDLVRQILAFARQSEETLKPIPVDLIAAEAIKFVRSSIPATIEIKQNIESDSLVMGNATQVHQVLMNLFTNAAYAMEDEGGILEFSLKDVVVEKGLNRERSNLEPGNYIEMKISDTGVGIAPEIIGSIFDPYFTTKGPGEGTGMGLAVVHGIIESYGGNITVESKPGQGTLFTIYLPVTRKRQEHHPYQSGELPRGRERILFVDDEAAIAKMGSQTLGVLGYDVTTRTSGVEALALFRTGPNDFDLVITDMTMPNMTGDKLAMELMKLRPDIPVILCTGYSKKISDETASDIGIKAFIYKPVVKADLAKTVRKVLDEVKETTRP